MKSLEKWIERQNSKRRMIFGVHEAAKPVSLSLNGGESNLRYLSIEARKALIRDNIECIKIMRTKFGIN